MATRMQQRRGTAAQWTSANPILAAGEMGFETDTNKFKIGDGTNNWASLAYFVDASIVFDSSEVNALVTNAVNAVIDGAPATLNTLNEIAAALNDDENLYTTVTGLITTASNDTLANLAAHYGSGTNVHGIADTSALATTAFATNEIQAHANVTTNIHGIADVSLLATQTYADTAASNAVTQHLAVTTNVHGIADTSALATQSYADSAVSTHNSETTSVHGIANTAALATKSYADAAVAALTKSSIGLSNVDNTSDASKPISTATQTALDLKAPIASPTFTGTVSGITKSMVDLGNVDNTSDANKPVSTATQTALDLKADLASPTFTGTPAAPTATAGTNTTQVATTAFVKTAVDNVIAGAPGALDTLNELSAALGNDANYASTITSALALKAPLASPTFTGTVSGITATMVGLGNVDNTSDANKPVSTATQTALDLKAPIASPTFTGTVTVAASGVAFTDGTQTKEGVPSRTTIISKSTSYTLSDLAERDDLIEVNSAYGCTITIPTNSSVAYPVGTSIDVLQTGAGQVTIAGDSGVTVNGTPGLKLRTQWSSATLFKRATDSWVVLGDLTA